MVTGTQEFLHIVFSLVLCEDLVGLRGNLVEQFATADVLHDKVDVLLIDVGLVVLHDIGVVELGENTDLFLDSV